MSICRRSFLKSTAATGVAACMPTLRADEQPRLKVALMSDTHVTRSRNSVERTRMAMELFKRLGVDVMAHVGDLADWHYPEAYGYYREALDAVFPPQGKRPVLIYAFGDHDALNPAAQKNLREKRVLDRLWSFADMKERLKMMSERLAELEKNRKAAIDSRVDMLLKEKPDKNGQPPMPPPPPGGALAVPPQPQHEATK